MHRVVILGCGFAGLFAAKALRGAPVASWAVAFLGRGRRQRTITKQQVLARTGRVEPRIRA